MSQISLQNICVFIKDEKQLQEAIGVLNRHDQKIFFDCFFLSEEKEFNYLQLTHKGEWYIGHSLDYRIITLTELEKLLEDESS